jgi:hypothetical protein
MVGTTKVEMRAPAGLLPTPLTPGWTTASDVGTWSGTLDDPQPPAAAVG